MRARNRLCCVFISYRPCCELAGKPSPLCFGLFPSEIRFQLTVFLILPTFESLSSRTGDLLCWGINKFKQAWGTLSLWDTLISVCRSISAWRMKGSMRITLAFADDQLWRQQDFGCMCCSSIWSARCAGSQAICSASISIHSIYALNIQVLLSVNF